MSDVTRMLEPTAIAVSADAVWLADALLPVVVEVDAHSGAVRRLLSWPVDTRRPRRPAIVDLVASPRTLWVLSARAGGVVAFSLVDGIAEVIPLPKRADALWPDGDGCIVREWTDYAGDWNAPHPQKLWRVRSGSLVEIELGAAVRDLAVLGDSVVALVSRGTDVPVRRPVAEGVEEVLHPGALVSWEPPQHLRVVRSLEDTYPGNLLIDGVTLWTTGFDRDEEVFRRVDPQAGELGLAHEFEGHILDIALADGVAWIVSHAGHDPVSKWDRARTLHRVEPDGRSGSATWTVSGELEDLCAVGHHAWAVRWHAADEGWDLVRFTAEVTEPTILSLDVDLTEFAGEVEPPRDVSPVAFAEQRRRGLASVMLGGWVDESGARSPLMEDVSIESVEVVGSFPKTAVVACFRATYRPGLLFRRSWRVFDDLGQPIELDWEVDELIEDVEAGDLGLPPLEQCRPDANGIVWF